VGRSYSLLYVAALPPYAIQPRDTTGLLGVPSAATGRCGLATGAQLAALEKSESLLAV